MLKKIHLSKTRILYIFCFFLFCLIDQRVKTGSGLDGWIETFRNLAGAVIALLILSHHHLNDFLKQKIPYLVWSLICVIGGAVFLYKGQSLLWFLNARIALLLSVFLMGLSVIRTFVAVFLEKRYPKLNRKFGLIWLIMMIFMVLSRSDYLWPLAYMVMFGCFYLTDYSAEEQTNLFHGMLEGIILAFFLLQGWCFAFRPYDAVRYVGVYNNCNMNALFYLLVLAAALAKLLHSYRHGGNRWLKLFYIAGSGVVLAFIFLTISRTAWFVAVIMVFVAIMYIWRMKNAEKLYKSVVKSGLMMVCSFALMFPLVFSAVRYLPPLFHHPVWFYGEWSEKKVHSWDKWDSEKFVSFDKLMSTSAGRVAVVFEALFETGTGELEADTEQGLHLEVEGVNMADGQIGETVSGDVQTQEREVSELQQQLYDEAYAAGYALNATEPRNPVKTRMTIYRFYSHLLNFRGHTESEQGFQILPWQRIGHAHNIYLQYGVDFGVPVLVLFTILVVGSGVNLSRRGWKSRSEEYAGELIVLLVPALFGLLEYSWGSGSTTVILLFVVWRRMICNERE